MKKLNVILYSIFLTSVSLGQDPVIAWQNGLGGVASDNLIELKCTSDGGAIVGGYSLSGSSADKSEGIIGGFADKEDYWVVKLNNTGAIQWENTIGGNGDDFLTAVELTTDGGYIIGGYSNSGITGDKSEPTNGSSYDYWVLKLNASGNIVWQNDIGGGLDDYLYDITTTNDGGYLLAGYSSSGSTGDKSEANFGSSDYWVVKLNSSGAIVWQNSIGGSEADQLFSVSKSADGGYFLGGHSKSGITGDKTEASNYTLYYDYWIIKLNALGAIVWQNDIGGHNEDLVYDIDGTSDGGCIVTGASESNNSSDKNEDNIARESEHDYWIIKLDAAGAIEKQNTIGTSTWERAYSLYADDDGYIVGGYTSGDDEYDHNASNAGNSAFWIMKLNFDLNIVWQYTLGGALDNNFRSLDVNAAGDIMIGGYTNSGMAGDKTEASMGSNDYWVLKLNAETCTAAPLYTDHDDDSFGKDDGNVYWDACENAYLLSLTSDDCDDMFNYASPVSTEICDGLDNDCNGLVDDGIGSCDPGPAIENQNTIGGFEIDELHSIDNTPDGGYIIAGTSTSPASGDKSEPQFKEDWTDYWVVKTDAALNLEWENTIGGSWFDIAEKVLSIPGGGYLLGGSSSSGVTGDKTIPSFGPSTTSDYWVMKLDNAGNIVWQKVFGGVSGDYFRTACLTSDGGFLLGGNSGSSISGNKTEASPGGLDDIWMIKINSIGNIEWQNSIGGNGNDYISSVIQTSDGNYLLGGYSYSDISGDKTEAAQGGSDYWVIKLNTTGSIIWQNTIGGSANETLKEAFEDPEGNIILAGYSLSPVSGDKSEGIIGGILDKEDYWIVKLNSSGDIIWENTLGGNHKDYLEAATCDASGNIVIGGRSQSGISGDKLEPCLGSSDNWILKLDTDGNIIWQNTIGAAGIDDLIDMITTNEGGFLLGGTSTSNILNDKYEPSYHEPEFYYSFDYWIVQLASDCVSSPEVCNTIDDNCNGLIDDAVVETINISAGGATTFCQGNTVLLSSTYSGTSIQWKRNGTNIAGATSSTYSVNKTGNYTAVTTSPCGTATSSTINVTVNKNPNASISAGGSTTFCAGGSVTLTEVPVAGCSYQWFKGASAIAGATSTNYIATTAGNYKCRVTKTASGCFKNSNTISVTVPCKEGENLLDEENNNFTIYPNPNNGTFNLAYNVPNGGVSPLEGGPRGVMLLEIFNSLGQQIHSQQINSHDENINETISINNLSSGIYFIRINIGINYSMQKLIIQK